MPAILPQIPSPADVIGPGIDALLAVRPTAAPHVDTGRYGDIVAGTRAQFEVARKRLVSEVLASRLPFAEGDELTDLAASEYETPRQGGAVEAIGEVILTRSVVHYAADDLTAAEVDVEATDEASIKAVAYAAAYLLLLHANQIWSPGTGYGSHAASAVWPTLPNYPGNSMMSDHVAIANLLKTEINAHFLEAVPHPSVDTVNTVTVADAYASNAAVPFASNSVQAQTSVLTLVQACYDAVVAHVALQALAGTIRAGTTWSILTDPTAVPAVPGAQYVAALDTTIATGAPTVTVPIVATRAGASGNVLSWSSGGPTLRYTTPTLFDNGEVLKLATTSIRAAGGSNGQTDSELRRAAGAAPLGRGGPTVPALYAGALRTTGASRTVVLENKRTGAAVVYPVDPSWAQSDAWNATVEQELRTGAADNPDSPWLGFGCKLEIGAVRNKVIRVDLTVALRDAAYTADTSLITATIQRELRAYFDDRRDWYLWRAADIKGIVTSSDRIRVMSCPIVYVRDHKGRTLAAPTIPAGGEALDHFVFADNAVQITYTAPA